MRWLLAIAASGCLSIPEPPPPECLTNADCDTALGEVCTANACYGGPPAGMFGAVITAPAVRPDLIAAELGNLTLPENGDLGTLNLEAPVHITGRVEAFCPDQTTCSQTSLDATILVTRAPLFAGGTGFSTSTRSTPNLSRGVNSFTASVPRSQDGDPPYVISVVPAGNGLLPPQNGTTSPAQLAPPTAIERSPQTDITVGTIVLGSKTSPVVTGNLSDGSGQPLT
ncbi:MAG TPA: hypothetical protein VGC41_02055, partial [Kofleriaceae bacterium]